ncbi:MAG TPA: peptidylprolyl isomerase [Flavobacteriaceae bacterium]|nr:peptidylprolyl isomerase [Flavobacteriaceae bacterium]
MAVLNKIRQRSIFLIVIIALALFSFVLSDIIRNGGFSSSKADSNIGSVNDEEVEREDFARQVESFQRNSQRQMTTMQAVNQVWDSKVRELLLAQQMEELGIDVGRAQINELLEQQLANNPNFADESGFFSFDVLREYVANLKATSPQAYDQWVSFENSVAQAAKAQIYFDMIKAGVGATLLEGKQAYQLETDNIDIQYVQIPYTSVEDVKISDDDVMAYMKNHSEKYKSEASRDIQYVLFQETPSEEDELAVKEDLMALMNNREEYNSATKSNDTIQGFKSAENYKEFVNRNSDIPFQDRFYFKENLPEEISDELFSLNKGEIYGPYKLNGSWNLTKLIETKNLPDSVKASHILISWEGLRTANGITRSKEEAKSLADSLLVEAGKSDEKFDEIAAKYSADNSNKDNGGDLGWFTYGQMVPPFNDYVFSNKKGDIGIVETDFGFHIVSIEDQTEEEKAIKIATVSRKVEASEKTMNDLYTKTTSFQLAAGKEGFNEVAKSDTLLKVRPVKGIKVLDENLPGIGAKRNIVQWAFQEDVEVGDIKRFDVNGGYAVVQLTGKNPEGLMSVEKASATIKPILQKEKKAEIIKGKINGNDLAVIAQNNGTQIKSATGISLGEPMISGAGNEPEVVGAAFSLNEGQTTAPIAGEKGVYVVKVTNRTEAPELASYAAIASQETEKRSAAIGTGNGPVVEALKEAAEIEDNRATFY